MTLQPGKLIIVIHILPNNARRKGNQTIKFGQLIKQETNMRNLFLPLYKALLKKEEV